MQGLPLEGNYPNQKIQLKPVLGDLYHPLQADQPGVLIEQIICSEQENRRVGYPHLLIQAWQRVVERHPLLKTSFSWSGQGVPLQTIHPQVQLPIEHLNWRHLSAGDRSYQLQAYLQADRQRGFDLTSPPPLRLALLQIAESDYKIICTFDKIILDNREISILLNEVKAYYSAASAGNQDLQLEQPLRSRDYIERLQQEQSKAEAFWRRSLSGFTAPTPHSFERTDGKDTPTTSSYKEEQLRLGSTLSSALNSVAEQHNFTLNTLLMGAWALLLNRYSGEEDVVFGVKRACRQESPLGAESVETLFINPLPLRVGVSGDLSLLPWLNSLQAKWIALQDYQYTPLAKVFQWSDISGGTSLFESVLVFENYQMSSALDSVTGGSSEYLEFQLVELPKFPLTVYVCKLPELLLKIEYDRQRFEPATITRMLGHLLSLLEGMVGSPDRLLAELSLLTPAEQQQLLVKWNDTRVNYPQAALCVHQLFEDQVTRSPDITAVLFPATASGQKQDEQLTYLELNQRSNQLAHHLQQLGVGPDVLVGIYMERSTEMAIAILGILKAGGAYVPLDPAYPKERLTFMLTDTQAPVVLTKQHLAQSLPENQARVISLDADWETISLNSTANPTSSVTLDNLTYAIYTSGSTGKPKGVALEHRPLSNLIAWQLQNSTLTSIARTLQFASLSFDVSFQEMFSTWSAGGTLVLISEELRRDAVSLLHFINNQKIERLFLPFIALQHLAEAADNYGLVPATLREVVTAGEQLQINRYIASLFTKLENCTLNNQYGPSESHVVTAFTLTGSPSDWPALPPIGRPIANAQIYLLDRQKQPVAVGVPGEVYIGGVSLARGYLNRPELTEEKFIPNPFPERDNFDTHGCQNPETYKFVHNCGQFSPERKSSSPLYETGDLARYLPDGNIEYPNPFPERDNFDTHGCQNPETDKFVHNCGQFSPERKSSSPLYETGDLARYLPDGNIEYPNPFPERDNFDTHGCQNPQTNKFVHNCGQFSPERKSSSRLYKTGDLARYLPDGNIEYLGRIDNQVKIRGFRIEVGEIETVLGTHPAVKQAVVLVREDEPGDKRLVAYLVPNTGEQLLTTELRRYLHDKLPDYMIPAIFVTVEALPQTPSGKIDRRALPAPTSQRPQLSQAYVAPQSELESFLASVWSKLLKLDRVGIHDNFFELGGNSLLTLQVALAIQEKLQINLSVVKLFQYSTISELAKYLSSKPSDRPSYDKYQPRAPRQKTDGIAIIGMVGRFPGAATIDEFWQNVSNGVESTTFFTDDELDPSIDPTLRKDPNYVKARGIIQDADCFDAAFFGINPREAELMDPQQRVFLEMAWASLENAGYEPESFNGSIGVFAGMGNNTYFANNVSTRQDLISQLGEFQVMVANEKDYLATRVSYKLNLTGPSVSIHTACSTSLVAVCQAFQSLMSYQCDMAIAGGISIATPQNSGYLSLEGGMLSGDGHCRPFDAKAQGTVFSNGVGVVVLKRLEDALQDGDRIYAVVIGAAINNDGAGKVSFAAPSVNGQASAIAMAQAYANVDPETISYIQTHGTATPLGDPIEIEALTQAFRAKTNAKQFCAIASIKSNFGHLIAAAGVAGLIQTALALKHKQLPPSLHFENPNPAIDFANSPFYVNAKLSEWKAGSTPRRAGVSSFGVGGTNAHVVLEEAPYMEPSGPSRPRQLLLLSATTQTALDAATENLRSHLTQHPEINLADVSYTLQTGRKAFNYRRFAVVSDKADAISALESLPPPLVATRYTESRNPAVVFMFPGQGAQYVNMGLNLYQGEPKFRETLDLCAEILRCTLGRDLRDVLYPGEGEEEAAAKILRETFFTQPAIFAIEYALAQLWGSWGVHPQAMIGHSIGEFVAACLAGVFSLEDGLMLVANRGRLMQELPGGSMLSVRMSAAEVEKRLSEGLAIAAINAPDLCVVSGSTEAIAALSSQLESESVICKQLHTSHAFHSAMMDPIVEPFAKCVREVQLSPPRIPFVSTATGTWITAEQASDPAYWAKHLRATVRFGDGVQELWKNPDRVLLEVGPRTTAATLARKQAKDIKKQIAISSLGDTAANGAELTALLNAVGQLWLAGASIQWHNFYGVENRHRVALPTYPFERKRFWVEPKKPVTFQTKVDPRHLEAIEVSEGMPELEKQIVGSMSTSQVETKRESRQQKLVPILKEVIEETSGLELVDVDEGMTFLEMGLDSLSLTQLGLTLQKKFSIKVTFRHLLENYPTLGTLAEFIDRELPPEIPQVIRTHPEVAPEPISAPAKLPAVPQILLEKKEAIATSAGEQRTLPVSQSPEQVGEVQLANVQVSTPELIPIAPPVQSGTLEYLISQQLQIMSKQLELLGKGGSSSAPPVNFVNNCAQNPAVSQGENGGQSNGTTGQGDMGQGVSSARSPIPAPQSPQEVTEIPPQTGKEAKKTFGAGARIDTSEGAALTKQQLAHLEAFVKQYTARTQKSKEFTQSNRHHLADPRAVSGFNKTWKELVYPIVAAGSSGSKIWDLDGNEYVDLTNGFGSNFFGYSAPFITEAVEAQLKRGFEIGPGTPLAGEVAELICEFTKLDRVAFCNTGSEAVLGAMRLARTVTGRSTIAIFSGAYHGIFDEVIVRGTKKLRSLPAAPGIPSSAVENLLVVDYDTPESLEILRARADELAAILVEPVQSRRPELQPREFLHQLRHLTEQSGAALIIDEVITGFRIHPGGAQAHFGVQADLATYGKVVGGGLPIGVIAGKPAFMDALDGGFWQFGDDSFPEVGVTYFAGTFVRHPLAMAAAKAALEYLKRGGDQLQRSLNQKTDQFVAELNAYFEREQTPFKVNNFGSLFKVTYPQDFAYGELLFYGLRHNGVHVWDHRPCFLTLAHSEADIAFLLQAFKQSVGEMQEGGFLPQPSGRQVEDRSNTPPVAGAKLGRDPNGKPGWYVPDPDRPGKYLQVGDVSRSAQKN